jgi:transposase
MGHIVGQHRGQMTLLAQSLDDFVGTDHPVRVIDAFVDGLDLATLKFLRAEAAAIGRPSYDPGDLLKLYLYGYLNRVRSSRRLEQEARRNVEVMWLVGGLAPDFKTIADFRKDNAEPLRATCREFVMVCGRLSLFGAEWVAIDGSHIKGVNSKARNFSKEKLAKRLESIDRRIDGYLKELDQTDATEAPAADPSPEEVRTALAALKERRAEYQEILTALNQSGETQISLTDPDARAMTKGHKTVVGYNTQLAVDAKHKLIVAHDVTNRNLDREHLSDVAKDAKETLKADTLAVIGDKGYYDGAEIKKCVDAGITPYVPGFATSNSETRGLFGKQHFQYDPQTDTYRCPAGEILNRRYEVKRRNRIFHVYETKACAACALKRQCTKRIRGERRIERWEHEALLDTMRERVKRHPELKTLRASTVEHPFGVMKHVWDQGHFLTRSLKKVRTEMSLSVLAYNLRRTMNILGCTALTAALTT